LSQRDLSITLIRFLFLNAFFAGASSFFRTARAIQPQLPSFLPFIAGGNNDGIPYRYSAFRGAVQHTRPWKVSVPFRCSVSVGCVSGASASDSQHWLKQSFYRDGVRDTTL